MPWAHVERLAAHPQLWLSAADQVGSGIGLVAREDLRFLAVNETLARMNSASVEEHVGRTVPEVMTPRAWAWVEPLYDRVFTGEDVVARYTESVEGGLLTVDVRLSPIWEEGQVAALLVVATDVSVGEAVRQHSDQLLVLALELNLAQTLEEVADAVASHSRYQLGTLDAGVYWRASPHHLVRLSRAGILESRADDLDAVDLGDEVPVARTVLTGQAAWLERPADWQRYPGIRAAVEDLNWPVVGVLPLRAADEVRGVLYLTFEGGREVPEHVRQAARTLAALCGAAVERLVRAGEARAVLEERDRLSQAVQTALLPAVPAGDPDGSWRVVTAYQPGDGRLALGGDFYDVVRRPDGRLGLLVGDVCGHGPLAAAAGAACRIAWRTGMLAGESLPAATMMMDRVLRSERDDDGMFATVLSGAYDPHTHELELLDAGHPAPVLVDATSGSRTLVVDHGPLLGVVDDAAYTAGTIRLHPGQALLMFTDGLVEGRRRPSSTERLGDAGLHQLLAGLGPEDLLAPQRLIDAANARHGADLPDDVALLVLLGPQAVGDSAATAPVGARHP